MDLIAQGVIHENFIEPSFELVDTFNAYYAAIMPVGSKANMAYPFSRLKTDGFWDRVMQSNYDPDIEYNIKSMVQLRQAIRGAKMNDQLFSLLCNPEIREHLRMVLINTYFAPEVISLLVDQGKVNYEAYE
jgi:predicted restriction endonuclease